MIGTSYLQQNGNALRTGSTPEALKYMDCSEFVARVLAADGITNGVINMNTDAIKALISQRSKFIHSTTPQPGDIALWAGHVGIVSAVNAEGNFKMIHASGAGRPALENKFFTTSARYRTGTFYGYYRPVGESPVSALPTTVERRTPKAKPNAHSSPTRTPTLTEPHGQRSGADGTFPLPEVTVVPAPGQVALPQVSAPTIRLPQLDRPSFENLPITLPRK